MEKIFSGDAPPGFPPKTCSSSGAGDSSGHQNKNGYLSVHGQFQTPDVFAEQPPCRTTRKRSRPNFYKPPSRRQPAALPTARRRGRPPKARVLSQFWHQEPQSTDKNEVLLRTPEEQMPWLFTSVQIIKGSSSQAFCKSGKHGSQINISPSPDDPVGQESHVSRDTSVVNKQAIIIKRPGFCAQDFQETLTDISPNEEAPRPVDSCKRENDVGRSNEISDGVDLKILQHAANAVCLDDKKVTNSGSSYCDKELARMLTAINKKHGDITQDCSLESDCMKTLVVLGICKVVQDLEKKQLKDIDISSLDSYYTAVRDAQNMKLNVQWLHNRLHEIKDAVNLSNEAKEMLQERNRQLESIDRKKKELLLRKAELERLESEVQGIEEQLAQEQAMVKELNKRFSDRKSNLSQFQHTYLMDGLI